MLEPAGDLGLEQEAGAAGEVRGLFGKNLLEGDLAVELASSATLTMPMPPRAWGRSTRKRPPVDVGWPRPGLRSEVASASRSSPGFVSESACDQAGSTARLIGELSQSGVELRLADLPEARHQCWRRRDRGETSLEVAAVLGE